MEEIKALTKVIGPSTYSGSLRVVIGYSYSHIDGGCPRDIKSDRIPQDLRMPNSEFILIMNRKGEVIGVERIK